MSLFVTVIVSIAPIIILILDAEIKLFSLVECESVQLDVISVSFVEKYIPPFQIFGIFVVPHLAVMTLVKTASESFPSSFGQLLLVNI